MTMVWDHDHVAQRAAQLERDAQRDIELATEAEVVAERDIPGAVSDRLFEKEAN